MECSVSLLCPTISLKPERDFSLLQVAFRPGSDLSSEIIKRENDGDVEAQFTSGTQRFDVVFGKGRIEFAQCWLVHYLVPVLTK